MKLLPAIVVLMSLSTRAQAQALHIPALHGTALSGDKVDLPDALRGKSGILVLGFSQASRDGVTAWGKRLAAGYRDSPTVMYYEMPVLESVPRMLRGWVTKKISEDVPDRAKNRFLPVLDHESAWKSAAQFGKGDDAYVLIVDSDGAVRGRIVGAASDANYAEVKRLLEAPH
jgi:hypothetical protein